MKRSTLCMALASALVAGSGVSQVLAQRPCTATQNTCSNATVTTRVIQIGGAGSLSSNGPSLSNPGRLDDGTIAEADLNFSFDRSTGILTLVAENETTTTASLTAIGFNVTSDVTNMVLLSENGSLTWELAFDSNRTDGVVDSHPSLNELRMDGFGRFNVFIGNKGIATGGNGGDKDEILAGQSVTFTIQVSGNLSNITACSFTSVGSYIPPGDKIVTAVGRFQAGVQGGSGFIGPCTGSPLLVSLSSLSADNEDGEVAIRWVTATEIDNAGFRVLRRNVRRGTIEWLNAPLIPGQGTEISGAAYEFRDREAVRGVKYDYLVEDWDLSGVNTIHEARQAVPNPDHPRIRLESPAYDETAGSSIKFAWKPDGRMKSWIEVSSDPAFPSTGTLRISVGARNGRTLSGREADAVRSMGRSSVEGGVYWRVVGRDSAGRPGDSQTYFLGVR